MKSLQIYKHRLMPSWLDKPPGFNIQQERQLAEQLRRKCALLKAKGNPSAMRTNSSWNIKVNRLCEHIARRDVRSFLTWDVVRHNMFESNMPYVLSELKFLKGLPNWRDRWSEAIVESPIGNPTPFIFFPRSSGNLIHHAYHLALFEHKTGIKVDSMEFVFEFGAGYGSMCRLFHNLGFKGRYVMFDLPAFSMLQEYYVRMIGLAVYSLASVGQRKNGVVCVSEMEDIQNIGSLLNSRERYKSLFLATWSLSEAPISHRNLFTPLISDIGNILIAYQSQYEREDNIRYFKDIETKLPWMSWYHWEIPHLRGNYYLMGTRSY